MPSLSSLDHQYLTRSPGEVGVVCPEQRPLPLLVEPDVHPLVVRDSGEPLVGIDHPRIRVLPVYWDAGWSAALPWTLLRSGTADRLVRVAGSLPDRFGIALLDAHRGLALQEEIYEAAYTDPLLPPGFVSVPSADPATPPPHLTGGTVDVTLTWDGHPLSLGTAFDDFSPAARTDALESEPSLERSLRRLLFWSMRAGGFRVLSCEWWHFEYGTRRWAALTGGVPLYGTASPVPAQRRPV